MQITVHYMAQLRRAAGLASESVEVERDCTVAELLLRLAQGHGDNSMHMVAPGDTWDYVLNIPKTHPPGVYWFHTHAHSFAERQLMAGLSGTLIVDGFKLIRSPIGSSRWYSRRLSGLLSAISTSTCVSKPSQTCGAASSMVGPISRRSS